MIWVYIAGIALRKKFPSYLYAAWPGTPVRVHAEQVVVQLMVVRGLWPKGLFQIFSGATLVAFAVGGKCKPSSDSLGFILGVAAIDKPLARKHGNPPIPIFSATNAATATQELQEKK
jgi:hypothetical protein